LVRVRVELLPTIMPPPALAVAREAVAPGGDATFNLRNI